jgi:hypothetical protein
MNSALCLGTLVPRQKNSLSVKVMNPHTTKESSSTMKAGQNADIINGSSASVINKLTTY